MLSSGIEELGSLRERWSERHNIRIERFLDVDVADALSDALCEQHMVIKARPSWSLGYQYFEYSFQPEAACDHVLCKFGRWWRSEGCAWVRELVGSALEPSPDGHVVSTLYTKGCYLDAHNDYDGRRVLAFIIGLTRDQWPADEGGHLEFLEVRDQRVRVAERREPGWGTLDLFEVSALEAAPLHRIPVLEHHRERRAISGWFYKP
jgi:hypothetical protein